MFVTQVYKNAPVTRSYERCEISSLKAACASYCIHHQVLHAATNEKYPTDKKTVVCNYNETLYCNNIVLHMLCLKLLHAIIIIQHDVTACIMVQLSTAVVYDQHEAYVAYISFMSPCTRTQCVCNILSIIWYIWWINCTCIINYITNVKLYR